MPRRAKQGDRSEAPVEVHVCDHCGARLTSAGRRSKLGRYWCSTKPGCVAAKQRYHYQARIDEAERADAPTSCHCCGLALAPRKVRFNDPPQGRWCHRARCQREKRLVVAAAAKAAENSELVLAFVAAASVPENRVLCPECDLENAVKGFIHPVIIDGVPRPCLGVGDQGVSRQVAEYQWPSRFLK